MYTTLIAAAELARLLDAGNVRVFDVRHDLAQPEAGMRAWRESRIPGAVYLDVEQELSGARTAGNGRHPLPARDDFYRLMVEAGVSSETQVVVYDDQGGMMAARLWWMLRWLGHEAVAVLDGGWSAWTAAGLPIDREPMTGTRRLPGAAEYPLVLSESRVGMVNADQVLANLATPEFVLLDARAAARYRGEVEPLDPVAGHIPGALNHPHTQNLGSDGCFKSTDALRADFGLILDGRPPQDIVHQCGSGISACHNLLAMEHAGLTGSRLYPGSWSEWCSDPVRPVA